MTSPTCAQGVPCAWRSASPRYSAASREIGRSPPRSEQRASLVWCHEPIAQLATRIPKDLHRRLKLHCVTNDIMIQDFVVEAIEEKLGRKAGAKKGTM